MKSGTGTSKSGRPQLHKRIGWRTAWQIVEHFAKRKMAAAKACEWLGIGKSRLYELRRRYVAGRDHRQEQADWLYRRRAGSGTRLASEVRSFVEDEVRWIKEQSEFFRGHFNFAVLAQMCQKRFGKSVHRNTLRRWAIREGHYDPKTDACHKAYVRFETGGVGMLFQHDSSRHVWIPASGRYHALLLTIDDHSRKVVGARLVEEDDAWNHLCLVRNTLEAYGAPLAYYTDNGAIFAPQTELHTQFGRALAALEITLKLAGPRQPQAKGKVEKRFDYFQRRVPWLCDRYRIKKLGPANRVLDEEVRFFNESHPHDETKEIPDKRWERAVKEKRCHVSAVNLPEHKLDKIFALHHTRGVRKDGSINFDGRAWRFAHAPVDKDVTVMIRPPQPPWRPHTEMIIDFQGHTLARYSLPEGLRSTPR